MWTWVPAFLAASGACSLAVGAFFGQSFWILLPLVLVWGLFVVAESAQFSLTKGAYAEPPEVAFPRKKDVDRNFLELTKSLLDAVRLGGVRAGFATHDDRLIREIEEEAAKRGIARGDLEFQMLYGIGTPQQLELAAKGYRVGVLISYGTAWFPWYMRRLAERPANLWFVIRKMVSC